MQTIFQIYKLSWMSCENLGQKISFILNNISGVVRGFFEFLVPFFTSLFVKSIQDGNREEILFYFYLVVISSGLEFSISRINVYFNEYLRYVLRLSFKKIYYQKLFNKPYSWHIQNSSGYFLSMLNNVAGTICQFIIKTTHGYINNFTIAFLFIIYSFYKSFYLGLYFTGGMLFSIIYSYLSYYFRLPLTNELRDTYNQFEKSYTDLLYNIKTVKKTNLLSFVFHVLNDKYDRHLNAGKRMRHYLAFQTIISKLYLLLLFAVPTGYFLYQYLENGEHLATIFMLVSIYPMLKNINNEFMNIAEDINDAKSHIDNLTKNFDEKEDLLLQKPVGKNIKHWHKFTFKDVSFTYFKKHSRFKSFVPDLEIIRGDHIAITGKSGEGKSTFLNLFTRQLNFESGQAFVDNIPYPQISESFFNSQITYISQDVELFDMSFYDNIVLGKKISKEKLYKVLEGCCLENLVARMNGDLDTPIGEKGIKVSGGERQRINLARGLLLDRDILVLDEITANLDPVTTERIWEYIFKEYKEKTIVAISHEKGLLQHTNKVVRFRNGKGRVER